MVQRRRSAALERVRRRAPMHLQLVQRPRESLNAHRRILAAIESGDPARAADAMRAHLRQVSDVALLRWEPPAEEDDT